LTSIKYDHGELWGLIIGKNISCLESIVSSKKVGKGKYEEQLELFDRGGTDDKVRPKGVGLFVECVCEAREKGFIVLVCFSGWFAKGPGRKRRQDTGAIRFRGEELEIN
jgi:hypothetical protein